MDSAPLADQGDRSGRRADCGGGIPCAVGGQCRHPTRVHHGGGRFGRANSGAAGVVLAGRSGGRNNRAGPAARGAYGAGISNVVCRDNGPCRGLWCLARD